VISGIIGEFVDHALLMTLVGSKLVTVVVGNVERRSFFLLTHNCEK